MADWPNRHEPRRKYDFRLVIHSTLPSVARQLVVPQGFTLSATGVFAILLERRPHPGPIAIWLFVAGARGLLGCGTGHPRAPVRQLLARSR